MTRFIIEHGVIHDLVTGKHVRTALNGAEDGVVECCALLNNLDDVAVKDGDMPTFEEAWAEKEASGYQYGGEALEQVRFGWKIRASAETKLKTALLFKTAGRLADARAENTRLRALLIEHDNGYHRCLVCKSQWAVGDEPRHMTDCALPNPRSAQALTKKENPST